MGRGRTTKDPKKYRIDIRVTETQVEILDKCVQRTGMNRTEVLMKGLEIFFAGLGGNNDEGE